MAKRKKYAEGGDVDDEGQKLMDFAAENAPGIDETKKRKAQAQMDYAAKHAPGLRDTKPKGPIVKKSKGGGIEIKGRTKGRFV